MIRELRESEKEEKSENRRVDARKFIIKRKKGKRNNERMKIKDEK